MKPRGTPRSSALQTSRRTEEEAYAEPATRMMGQVHPTEIYIINRIKHVMTQMRLNV